MIIPILSHFPQALNPACCLSRHDKTPIAIPTLSWKMALRFHPRRRRCVLFWVWAVSLKPIPLYPFLSCLLKGLIPYIILPYSWHLCSLPLMASCPLPSDESFPRLHGEGQGGEEDAATTKAPFSSDGTWFFSCGLLSFLFSLSGLKTRWLHVASLQTVSCLPICYSGVHLWKSRKHFLTKQVQQQCTRLVLLPFIVVHVFPWSCTFKLFQDCPRPFVLFHVYCFS